MPTVWFVFLSALPLPTSSEDNFPFRWEANLWKGREEETRRTGVYWQKSCLSENAGSDFLPVIITRKRKSIQSRGKSNVVRLPVCFSVNSQTFRLWYFTRGSSRLDAACLPAPSPGMSQNWWVPWLGFGKGTGGWQGGRGGSHLALYWAHRCHKLLYKRNIVIYKTRRLCEKETATEVRWIKPQENSWHGQENCGSLAWAQTPCCLPLAS